jgi:hypothetical protein
MSTNTPPTTPATPPAEKPAKAATGPVYVEIPRAKPGQEYRAPKNYQRSGLAALGKLVVVLACASLPIVPAAIIGMIVWTTYATEPYLLWLWATMTILVVGFAIFVAFGLAREAIGVQHAGDYEAPLHALHR